MGKGRSMPDAGADCLRRRPSLVVEVVGVELADVQVADGRSSSSSASRRASLPFSTASPENHESDTLFLQQSLAPNEEQQAACVRMFSQ